MVQQNHKKITIVGAGRIAWHLGKRLKDKGLSVYQVYNRSAETAQDLGERLMCPWTSSMDDIFPDTDWIIIAVRDDSIDDVATELSKRVKDVLVTHTSGATPSAVLAPFFERYGVLYPLQTFSMERTPVWSKIPFCVDASKEEDVLWLRKIAKTVGNLVYRVSDAQRAQLHIAAVFANNFANHCFGIAEQILQKQDLPFEMLYPLMEETLSKAMAEHPMKMQTGPAIRGDMDTIRRHLKLLEENPQWAYLYLKISQSIKHFDKNDLERTDP
jgi:predicted short-subunit dehydrogenase-like oxidoreductase (DUF2520 family)